MKKSVRENEIEWDKISLGTDFTILAESTGKCKVVIDWRRDSAPVCRMPLIEP